MLLLAGLLWRVLAFGTLVLPAAALRFNFTDVQQCDQVMISFAGSNLRNNSVPSSLSILPVNSTAILVPLPDPGIINTGVALTFLPFAAGTNFVASLDDSAGENLIFVSDLIRVLPSASGNSSCLSNPSPNQQKLFALTSPVSQCENITVTYNTTLTTKPPIVRLYNPKGRSFRLNQTSDDRASGTATYLMNFFRGREIILLMDDGDGVRETTPLLSVGGDSASDTSCIQRNFTFGFPPNNTGANDSNTTPVASKAVIIGGATGGGAVLLIGVCMVIFILRDRRRRRTKQLDTSQEEKDLETSENDEKNGGSAPVINVSDTSQGQDQEGQNRSTNLVANPIYTRNPSLLQSPPRSVQERGSMASWLQAIPDDQRYSAPLASPSPDMSLGPSRTRSVDNLSLQSLDIEGMLNMATLQSESYSRKNSAVGSATPSPVPLGRSPLASIARDPVVGPPSAYLRTQTSRRHLRGPSDVPAGPDSMAFSGYSVNVNPFDSVRNSMAASILNSPTTQYSSAPSPRGTRPPAGLPKSPRDSVRDRTMSAASSEWYGIAR